MEEKQVSMIKQTKNFGYNKEIEQWERMWLKELKSFISLFTYVSMSI